MTIPAVGTLSYNGYTFLGERNVTAEVRPVWDDAQRSVSRVEVKLTVTATIQADAGTNDTLDSIRRLLIQPGGALTYSGDGFGSLRVNSNTLSSGATDLAYGPKPEMLSWEPTGSARACEVVWTVTTVIPPCDTTNSFFGGSGLVELNFSVSFVNDRHGDATRTVSGYLKIAQVQKAGVRSIAATADDYLNRINPEPIIGFMRTTFERNISPDKNRLDFTVVDEQIKSRNAYPAYAVEISGNQTVNWGRNDQWGFRSSISMDVTTSSRAEGVTAWSIFGTILLQRLEYARSKGLWVFIDSVRIDEDIFGREGSFSAGFRFTYSTTPEGAEKTTDPKDIFLDMVNKTGLWLPTSTTWEQWRDSLLGSMFNPLGTSGIRLRPGDDQLVDACGGDFVLRLPQDRLNQTALYNPQQQTIENKVPPADKSYLNYNSSIEPMIEYPVSLHAPVQSTSGDTTGVDANNAASRTSTQPFTFTPLGGSALENSIHTRGNGVTEIRFKGTAVRAGYEVPRPKVQQIGDQAATERAGAFKLVQGPELLGVKTYAAAWDIIYVTPRPPANIKTLA